MSALVTEAHIAKARASGYTTDKGVQMAAQFIANNEAAKAERDQLRAEVERLTAEVANQKVQNNHNWQFQEISEEALKRAERAEAEVADLKANNRFHRGHSAGYAEAKADCEAELAAERARLDYMSNCVFEHLHNETGDHLGYEWTISSDGGSCDVTLRDVIDAEMKEEAK